MSILWLRFAEDSSLPSVMNAEARARFEAIFNAGDKDSLWSQALTRLGFPFKKISGQLIRWHGDTPYIDWSYTVALLSAGIVMVQRSEKGFAYTVRYRIGKLPALISTQWKLSRYILGCMEKDYATPESVEERIRESISLGLALLALTMRLPAHSEAQLALWLAKPEDHLASLRRTLMQMQRIQSLRTALSSAWRELFMDFVLHETRDDAPSYFWDDAPVIAEPVLSPASATSWKGLGVAGGDTTGRAVLVTRSTDLQQLKDTTEPLILIFPLARPDSVEYFSHCAGVLYGEGGIMSHACTIAREQNLPCITGLGKAFLAHLKQELSARGKVWITVKPQEATAEIIG